MQKYYYACMPNRCDYLNIEEQERKYDVLLKDVTEIYKIMYPKWSCGLMYMIIGCRENVLRYVRDMYFDSSGEKDYSKFLNEFVP